MTFRLLDDEPLTAKELRNRHGRRDRFETFEVLRALAQRGSHNSDVALCEIAWLNEVKLKLLAQLMLYADELKRLLEANPDDHRLHSRIKELHEVLAYVADPPETTARQRPAQASTPGPG